jgi:signal transduction histidine kinase/ligand-binding sensor domain-containing protein
MQNSTSLSSLVAVFFIVVFGVVSKASGDSSSTNPGATPQASVSTRPIKMPVVSGNDISFRELADARGLSQTRVLQIVQDDQGFMWFGTQYGLDRYDGYKFKVFTPIPGRVDSLSGAYIYSLFKDRDGMLWIGCDLSLDRFDPTTGKFTHYRIESDAPSRVALRVVHISQDGAGMLWLSTVSGLYGLDPGTGQITHHYFHDPHNPSSLSTNDLRSTGEDRSGRFWVMGKSNLEELDRETGKVTLRVLLPESGADSAEFYEDHLGTFWIVYGADRGGGLATFDRMTNKITNISLYDSSSGKMMPVGVNKVVEDEKGTLWFASGGEGLLKFDREHGRMIAYRNRPGNVESIAEDRVITLGKDQQGNIWTGFHARAPNVFSIKKTPFSPLLHPSLSPNSLGEYIVNAIYEDRERALWIGITGSLLRIDSKSGEYSFFRPSGPWLNFDPISITEDSLGTLWVGTVTQGLYRFNRSTGKFQNYVHHPDDPSSLSANAIIRIFIDHAGRMWLATWNGLDRFDPSTGHFAIYKRDVQSAGESYFDIAEDPNGGLWLGGTSGLQHFDPMTGKFAGYEHKLDDPHSLSDNRVTSVHVDHAGTVWAATESGLGKLNSESGQFTNYYTKDGLPSDRVNCILEDQRGHLWMSTNRGLSRFDPAEKTFRNYSTADGLPGMDFTGWLTCFKSTTGRMFFGGFSGATSFYPDRVVDSAYVPPIVFTDFRVFGRQVEIGGGSPLKKSISYAKNITLSHTQSTFAVEFAALGYSDNTLYRYRYKLDGLDQQWNETGSDQRMVNYTALPAGDYTFHVQATTGQSGWGLSGATLHIQVLPPWWRTWWFRAIVAVALLFLLWYVYHLRVRALKRRQAILEGHQAEIRALNEELIRAQEEERVRISGELHDGILQQMTSVTLTLGTMKYQVPPDSPAKSVIGGLQQKLVKIGTDIRHLSHELHPAILQNEGLPGALSSYCEEFSKVRGLNVSCETDESVEKLSPEAALCLYRVAQEALGNAAKYSEAKKIEVRLTQSDGHVCLCVSDDGIGCTPSKKSGGLGLINMRERVLQLDGTFEFDSEPGRGTTVKVKIPFQVDGKDGG